MNIVICGSQVPFVRGGAENLIDGLRAALEDAGHRVDTVSLPFKWYPKDQLLNTALAWRLLDLTESNGEPVDLVICTKFPTWAARHPRKVAWLVHQHRQAYDWFGTPLSDFTNSLEDRLVRQRIKEIDRRGLSECRQIFAISGNVADRLRRWNGLDAEVLPVPITLGGLKSVEYGDYILSLSRLDKAKRVDLLIRALAGVDRARAVVAGDGPEAPALQALANRLGLSARVEFRGRVSDEEAAKLYNYARAVYYGPVDEDYGLGAVEALTAGKPVLTFADSGGVLQFVVNRETGFVTEPNVDQLANAIRTLVDDQQLAQALGEQGRLRVADLSWADVAARLVSA